MKAPAARSLRRSLLAMLVLLCIAGPLMTACGPAAVTPTREATSVQPVAATAVRTVAPSPTSTVVPTPLPAGHILLPTGGRLIVPEGALPADTEIHTLPTCAPLLHRNMTAVSTAVIINAAQQPVRPLMLRIPVPEGTTDPSTLVIVRVEPDGTTTFLMTEVEGDELVSATAGYGTFVVVQGESSQAWVRLAGPTSLVPGESAVYYPVSGEWQDVHSQRWSVAGGMALTAESAEVALVQATEGSDWANVTVEFVNWMRGWRWFGTRFVRIDTGAEAFAGQPFKLSVVAETPLVTVGQDVKVVATAHGQFDPPLTWSWDFGDGETGGPVTTEGSAGSYTLPAKRYEQHSTSAGYPVTVTVKDARGREVRGEATIRARTVRTFWAEVEGPLQVTWISQEVEGMYTVRAVGGEAPYTHTLVVSPQEDWRHSLNTSNDVTCSLRPLFNEPGEYRLLSLVGNGSAPAGSAVAALPILAEGGQALRAELRNVPATATAGQQLSAYVQMQGGTLVVAGEKRGYTLQLDWGDGSPPLSQQNLGKDKTSIAGITAAAFHTYPSAGRYTVRAQVCDASGWSEAVAQEIVIATSAPVAGAATRTGVPETAAEQIPGTTVALATGGSVFVPEGALPAGATIDASVTRMPPLPDDVKPVGEAWSITASAQPSLPLTLRLPVPAGVSDREKLAILHIEADGTTTFLVTRVEDDELVAETLGLSTYVRAEVKYRREGMFGAERLLVGETSTYFLWISGTTTNVSTDWDCSGPAKVIASSDWEATVQAGPSPGGLAWLHYAVLEQLFGHRWEGFKLIVVEDNPQRFRVVAAAAPSVADIGQETVNIVATVHGDYQPPISWVWRFQGGGGGGEAETGAGVTRFELPPETYPAQDQPGIYRVRIWAEDAQHLWHESWAGYELVKAEPLVVELEGPRRLSWTSPPGVYEEYTAFAYGGTPPYKCSFLLFPGAKSQEEAGGLPSTTLRFDQPGEHRLEVTCTDAAGNTAKTSALITVHGGEPLSTRILELPATAQPQQEVTARIQIRGGVLVTQGHKYGYRLEVDWDDGSERAVAQNVGAQMTAYEGTVVQLAHTYKEAKQYTVRVEAFDAAGNMDWYEQDIVITAAPTPAQQPTTGGTQLVWVRQEPADFKYGKDAPYYLENSLAHMAGSFVRGTVSESSILLEHRLVQNGVQDFHLTFAVSFDQPPEVLVPGLSKKVKASVSHTGTNEKGDGAAGLRFQFTGSMFSVEPNESLRYYPYRNPPETSGKEWTVTPPPAGKLGDTYAVIASLPSHFQLRVQWNYRAEYR